MMSKDMGTFWGKESGSKLYDGYLGEMRKEKSNWEKLSRIEVTPREETFNHVPRSTVWT